MCGQTGTVSLYLNSRRMIFIMVESIKSMDFVLSVLSAISLFCLDINEPAKMKRSSEKFQTTFCLSCHQLSLPWQCLYFRPLPQGQGSLRWTTWPWAASASGLKSVPSGSNASVTKLVWDCPSSSSMSGASEWMVWMPTGAGSAISSTSVLRSIWTEAKREAV